MQDRRFNCSKASFGLHFVPLWNLHLRTFRLAKMTSADMANDEVRQLKEKYNQEALNRAQLATRGQGYYFFITVCGLKRFIQQVQKRTCSNVTSARSATALTCSCKRWLLMNQWPHLLVVMNVVTGGCFVKKLHNLCISGWDRN